MKRIKFNAAPHHTLKADGKEIRGGQDDEVTDEVAEELLTSPHLDVTEVREPTPPAMPTKSAEKKPAADGEGHTDEKKEL